MDKEDIIGFEALYNSMMKCKNRVRWKGTTGFYLHHWPTEIAKLEDELKSGRYKQKSPKFFTVTEPKRREIMSIHFRDRVFQRSLNDVALYPQTTKSFINDNFACQKGKGTDPARDRLVSFLRSFYRKYGREGYVLKIDIKGYYPNMNRHFAEDMLKGYVDDETYQIAEKVLSDMPGETGYNPGSQIVQIIGITALDKVDHFIKEQLRVKFYIRYMDDFVLLHPDKAFLESCLAAITEKLASQDMKLNTGKTRITELSDGILFLGHIFRISETGKVYVIPDPAKIKHEKRKLRRMIALMRKGELSKRDIDRHFKGFKASIRYGNTHKLIQNLNKWYDAEMQKGGIQNG